MMLPKISIAREGIDASRIETLEPICKRCIKASMEIIGLTLEDGSELSVLAADDAFVQDLNRRWRNIDKPTNVLSFPTAELEPGQVPEMLLGDIVISMDTVDRESDLESKPRDDHLSHLIVHGFLHLLGYDHETDKQADVMEALEVKILDQLGIQNPYANME